MPDQLWRSHTFTVLVTGAGESDGSFLSYDDVLSRVRVDVAQCAEPDGEAAPDGATWTVQRSTDTVHWTTVRGAEAVNVSTTALPVDDYEFEPSVENRYRVQVWDDDVLVWTFTDTITVFLTDVWVKSVTRPFLNRPVLVMGFGDIGRDSNSGRFHVVGRSLPVAVNDVAGSRSLDLQLLANDQESAGVIDLVIQSGDTILVQVPPSVNLPGGYYTIDRAREHRWPSAYVDPTEPRTFTLPLVQVAAPDASFKSAAITWRGLANRYGTWADVRADQSAWRDVMQLIGDPGDVFIP